MGELISFQERANRNKLEEDIRGYRDFFSLSYQFLAVARESLLSGKPDLSYFRVLKTRLTSQMEQARNEKAYMIACQQEESATHYFSQSASLIFGTAVMFGVKEIFSEDEMAFLKELGVSTLVYEHSSTRGQVKDALSDKSDQDKKLLVLFDELEVGAPEELKKLYKKFYQQLTGMDRSTLRVEFDYFFNTLVHDVLETHARRTEQKKEELLMRYQKYFLSSGLRKKILKAIS